MEITFIFKIVYLYSLSNSCAVYYSIYLKLEIKSSPNIRKVYKWLFTVFTDL